MSYSFWCYCNLTGSDIKEEKVSRKKATLDISVLWKKHCDKEKVSYSLKGSFFFFSHCKVELKES